MQTDPSKMKIFDTQLLRQKRKRCETHFSAFDFLSNNVADRLADRLLDIQKKFSKILILGFNTNYITHLVKSNYKGLNEDCEVVFCDYAVAGDEELLSFNTEDFDCVISHLNLHHINDVPGVLAQVKRILKPDGVFLAAFFGGKTLIELREVLMEAEIAIMGGASPRVAPFIDVRDAGALLQRAGFAIPVADCDEITVTYEHIFKLMHDLRGMGETNILHDRLRHFTCKTVFLKAGEIYHEKFSTNDGRIPARFDVVYMTGWVPHDSQQKPLKPGSARQRLADVLHTNEQGE